MHEEFAASYAEYTQRPERDWAADQARIAVLETALNILLPGLWLDLRYADPDDDRDAMQARIDTVVGCFSNEAHL
jgi:hypothetical protein